MQAPGTLLVLLGLLASPAFAAPPPLPSAARSGPGLFGSPAWTAEGDQADCRLGTVAPAGDVNGDGYDDLIVGAYNYDRPEVDEGVVFLFLGGPDGLSAVPAWIGESNQAGARLGDKLSGAGDVNGDGYDDVVLGAAFYDSTQVDGGAAFLYLGCPAGLQAEPAWIAVGDQAGAQFGACVQAAGDVNHDGYGDVIVGAWLYDHGETNEGRAFVYFGSDSGLADQPVWVGESGVTGAAYGYFCASAGDVDGDGFGDIVVGARRFGGNGLPEEGRVSVYRGGPNGPSSGADWVYDSGRPKSEAGAYTISAGDVNGDGYGDLLVGAFRWDNPELDAGKAMLFMGSGTGLAPSPAWAMEGGHPLDNFGYHLDGAGDVNGDGYDDVILSAPGADTGSLPYHDAGRALLYLGSARGLPSAPAWTQDGDQDNMKIEAVRGVGDVNGDGFDDVATGALYRDGAFVDGGRAWVFLGRADAEVGVGPDTNTGAVLALAGANPSARRTAFTFRLARPGFARLVACDLAGRAVAVLYEGSTRAGSHRIEWGGRSGDGSPVPPGVYLVKLETDDGVGRVKVVFLN